MNLEIIIPSDEPVRLLNAVTEELDYSRLAAIYSRLGRNEYSLRLLFKVVFYSLKLHHKIQTGRLRNHLFVPGAA